MKKVFLSLLVICVLFLIYLKTETNFFNHVTLSDLEFPADTSVALSEEAITDSVYQEDGGEAQGAVIAGTSDVPQTEEAMDASKSDAEFPGGNIALRNYISDNLKYPIDEKIKGIQGTCIIQFVVNADGTIAVPTIISPIKNGSKCNKEALRIIQSMPQWVPGTFNGKDVPSIVTLPIKFDINN